MFQGFLLVGLGGGIGSGFRFLTSQIAEKYFQAAFPYATFTANILGSLLIGILLGLSARGELIGQNYKLLFITGFCGGFTTFSAFASENISLFQSGNHFTALLYSGATIFTGLFAVWLGLWLVK